MSRPILARTVTRNQNHLVFEVITPQLDDGVFIGGPTFETVELDRAPPESWAIGSEFLLFLENEHELDRVEALPEIITDALVATKQVSDHKGSVDQLYFYLAATLSLNGASVPIDVAYAVITDSVLSRSWIPHASYELAHGRFHTYRAA